MVKMKQLTSQLLGQLPILRKPSFSSEGLDDDDRVEQWLQTGTIFLASNADLDLEILFEPTQKYRFPFPVSVIEREVEGNHWVTLLTEIGESGTILMMLFFLHRGKFESGGITILYNPAEQADRQFQAPNQPKTSLGVVDSLITEFSTLLIMFDQLANGEFLSEHREAPRILNQRRKRQRKQPLRAHHILKPAPRKTEAAGSMGGTHASPRLHLRRGHYRQYANGIKRWIKPSWVGDKARGVLTKTYDLSDGG
jgi:hypothetical protein